MWVGPSDPQLPPAGMWRAALFVREAGRLPGAAGPTTANAARLLPHSLASSTLSLPRSDRCAVHVFAHDVIAMGVILTSTALGREVGGERPGRHDP